MIYQMSPSPCLTWIVRKLPYMRRAYKIKDSHIATETDEFLELINAGHDRPRSALHSVLLRDRDIAARGGRQPNCRSRAFADELFGFMTAGYDTSTTTVSWGVKILTDNLASHTRPREELRQALTDAARETLTPTYAELDAAFRRLPYLEAVVEEAQRHANTITFSVRQAKVDTTLLGRRIPKGTEAFMPANGAGYRELTM